jgi:hypothetical protein
MPKLWNLLLTSLLLFVAYLATIALTYDGYCYGFTDGKSPCSFTEHFEANHAWFGFLLIFYLPHVVLVGCVVYFVNNAIYRAVVAVRARRWLREASDEPSA